MAALIDFYFDFSSPYGYFASTQIDALAARHGRTVRWRPFLLGAAFKLAGLKPLVDVPLKNDYVRRDFERTARLFGVPFRLPTPFPYAALAASRAFYWLAERDEALAHRFAKAAFHASLGEGRDITPVETVAGIVAAAGGSREAAVAALGEARVKDRLREEVEAALARGVFGSPYIVVDGEPFWGSDRLPQVERWLQTGGW